ncbi:MAG: phosphoglycerate kinase [Candidatus Shapirobacteria bacterium]|nr:phosphoglycerate kinase [Candidatus Shapirobacteria bacterium]
MEKLKSIELVPRVIGKKAAIFRADTDIPESDNKRLENSVPSIIHLLQKGWTIVIIGHKGRPESREKGPSLIPVCSKLKEILENKLGREINSTFIDDITDEAKIKDAIDQYEIIFTDNIRFYPGERKGDTSHLKILKKYCSIFVYDAIAVAHRTEGSVILHREMETYYGFNFIEEYQAMETLNKRTGRLVIFGGSKEDKLDNLIKIAQQSNAVFIGGKLPLSRQKIEEKLGKIPQNVFWAQLSENKYDLSSDDISKLKTLITIHPTIVWTGALGWFEKGYKKGTTEITTALIKSKSYIAIGGGDTTASIVDLGGKDEIDFPCSAGGALLFSLANGPENLPAVS